MQKLKGLWKQRHSHLDSERLMAIEIYWLTHSDFDLQTLMQKGK